MVSSTAKLAADAGEITFQAAAAVAPQKLETPGEFLKGVAAFSFPAALVGNDPFSERVLVVVAIKKAVDISVVPCLLYTSPSPRDLSTSRMPSSA